MKKWIPLFVILGVLLVVGLMIKNSYNGLVTASESVEGAWAEVETQYQRRLDLIPNLVETVKGYADFEKSTLLGVTEARAAAMGALRKASADGQIGEFEQANQQLGVAMGRFFGYTENYPDLKANQNFLELQAQLEGTENRISVTRDRYNKEVRAYNTRIKRFPTNLFASTFNFEAKDYFSSSAGAEEAPQIKF